MPRQDSSYEHGTPECPDRTLWTWTEFHASTAVCIIRSPYHREGNWNSVVTFHPGSCTSACWVLSLTRAPLPIKTSLKVTCCVWQYIPRIPAVRRPRQEGGKFKANLGYVQDLIYGAKAAPVPGQPQCLSESLHLLNLHYSGGGQVLHCFKRQWNKIENSPDEISLQWSLLAIELWDIVCYQHCDTKRHLSLFFKLCFLNIHPHHLGSSWSWRTGILYINSRLENQTGLWGKETFFVQ